METDVERLISGYLDGTAGAEGVADLDGRLRLGEETRLELLRHASLEAEVRQILRAEAAVEAKVGVSPRAVRDPGAAPLPAPAAIRVVSGRTPAGRGSAAVPRSWLDFPRLIPLAAAAGLVLAIGAVLFLGRERKPAGQPLAPVPEVAVAPAPQPPPEAELTQVAGDVRVASAGGEWRAATAGAAVRLGDAVAVGTNSAATVRFGDGSQLRLYARTRLAFDRWNGGKRLEMAGGALDAVVVPQPTNAPMVVETPFAVARVQGTQFRLLSDRASTWLGVREGRVVMVRKADQRAVAVVPQYYAVVAQGVPFGLLSNQCPYWRGRCTAMTGSVYP